MRNLQDLLSMLKTGMVYIRTHNFPDPDAIASAYGLNFLLKIHGIESIICFTGQINRYNTQKMIDLLEIPFMAFENIPSINEEDHIIYIDAQLANANVQKEQNFSNIHCIDHHPIYEHSDYLYSDIRPEYGSCSTIIGEYFLENEIPFTTQISTALIYGLKIDTANLSRGVSKADLDVFYDLYWNCDLDLLQALEHNTLMVPDLHAYSTAIQSLDIQGNYCFADAGSNCQEALIATICDFLISLAEIELAIVYSVKKEGIKISVRSGDSCYHSGEVCNHALQEIGSGGGHLRMAGGFVPFTEDKEHNKNLLETLKQRFKEAISINQT